VLEEVLQSFLVGSSAPSRIRALDAKLDTANSFTPPEGMYTSDFARHPSGEFSAVLVAEDRSVSLARLAPDLSLLSLTRIEDPEVVDDPHAAELGVSDLRANGFASDAARVGALDESAVVAVVSSAYAVIAYRLGFAGAQWAAPERTLLEPPSALTPFLPIGGSFDTFGALAAWFRCPLDVDVDGNVYVAVWAGQHRIRDHVAVFDDGLAPLPVNPVNPLDHVSDVLLTKMTREGVRVWSRVVGSEHEDEPYAIHAENGQVAVVGRARRFASDDNTFWDGLVSISTSSGELIGTRTLELNASSILLAVDRAADGAWWLAGSDGWSQNPEGLSIVSFGTKLLLRLDQFDSEPARYALLPGPRHNELRTVLAGTDEVWFGGHEDGPIMHTGDADQSAIHATGVLGAVAR